jgi:hypothetical protein
MSTNYYVRTAATPEGDEGIHLGKSSGGWPFNFRAYPDAATRPAEVTWDVTDYGTWERLLSIGQIVTEYGSPVTPAEIMMMIAERRHLHPHRRVYSGQFTDRDGNLFDPREFC